MQKMIWTLRESAHHDLRHPKPQVANKGGTIESMDRAPQRGFLKFTCSQKL
jgi:hypothetical protein